MLSRILLRLLSLVDTPLFWWAALPLCALAGVLRPSVKWTVFSGYALERLGRLEAARMRYDEAAERSAGSDGILELRWLHVAQYLQERLRAHQGQARVEDPLFACRAAPLPRTPGSPAPAGYYKAEFVLMGLNLMGALPLCREGSVDILLDGVLLRRVNIGGRRIAPGFTLVIKRPVLALFPPSSRLEIRTAGGRPLEPFGGGAGLRLTVPHGSGEIDAALRGGGRIDKKGALLPTEEELRSRQAAYLRLYELARDFFEERFGFSLFLMYGTLLGFYRNGDFIPGDDDFDAAYFSRARGPEEAKAEAVELIAALVRSGFTVAFNSRGRLFRIQHDAVGDASVHIDARPVWLQDGKAWAHNHFCMPSAAEHWTPALRGTLRGVKVYYPAGAETFFEAQYGSGWKVPDPGFTYYRSQIDPAVFRNLDKALMTPAEYRSLSASLEAERKKNPAMGRFVSIAAMELYPLSAFELDAD